MPRSQRHWHRRRWIFVNCVLPVFGSGNVELAAGRNSQIKPLRLRNRLFCHDRPLARLFAAKSPADPVGCLRPTPGAPPRRADGKPHFRNRLIRCPHRVRHVPSDWADNSVNPTGNRARGLSLNRRDPPVNVVRHALSVRIGPQRGPVFFPGAKEKGNEQNAGSDQACSYGAGYEGFVKKDVRAILRMLRKPAVLDNLRLAGSTFTNAELTATSRHDSPGSVRPGRRRYPKLHRSPDRT